MEQKQLKTSLIAIDGNRAYSKDEVFAYYRLGTQKYEFLDATMQENQAQLIDRALAGLITNQDQSVEGMLIVTSSEFNIDRWAADWYNKAISWSPVDGFASYVDEVTEHLSSFSFAPKEVYLAVKLGNRKKLNATSEIFSSVKDTINMLADFVTGSKDLAISEKEMTYWENEEKNVSRLVFASALQAMRSEASEIAKLYKKTFFPAMPEPEIKNESLQRWGEGEIHELNDSYIEKNRKFLKITQNDYYGHPMDGYVSTLCFSKFPDELYYPENIPWIYSLFSLGIPFTFYTRFTLEPARKVRKQIERKRAEIQDEAENAAGGGRIPLGLLERQESTDQLEYELSKDNSPWVFSHHRLVVSAPTEELLHDYVALVTSHYDNLKIKLLCPTGDQMNLLLESQPADKVRVKSYMQRQSLSIFSGGAILANSQVGDSFLKGKGWVGPYIGYTCGSAVNPVFFSPHVPISQNKAPGTVIIGSPGGGKSFLSFTLTCLMAIQGMWTIYIDPKADALPIQDLEGIGKVNVFDLKNGNDGILDPFSLGGSSAERLLLAIETIRILVGTIDGDTETALSNVIEEMLENDDIKPSLNMIVSMLQVSDNNNARNLGTRLKTISSLPFARLCFAPQGGVDISPRDGLTIITLLGIDLPTADTPPSEYDYPNRLAVAVMYLLTSFTKQLMMDMQGNHPRSVVIDEAWAVLSTSHGKKVVSELARMGRSLNTSITLVSQNAADFQREGLINSVSTKFAFKCNSSEEAENVIELFQLPKTQQNVSLLMSLETGQCIMMDSQNRTSLVQISNWNERWRTAFDTNPENKRKQMEDVRGI